MDLITLAVMACVSPNMDKVECQKKFIECVELAAADKEVVAKGFKKDDVALMLAVKSPARKQICGF